MSNQREYEKLRAWYLARLRRLSLQSETELQLTPGALISMDRENIEKMILADARTVGLNPMGMSDTAPETQKQAAWSGVVFSVVLAVVLSSAYCVLVRPFSFAQLPDLCFALLMAMLLVEALVSLPGKRST